MSGRPTVLCHFEGALKNVILIGVISVTGKVWINPAGKNTALTDAFFCWARTL